jgi:hypothetical protein
MTPALTSSTLNSPIAVSSDLLGMIPASLSTLALTKTMTFIDILLKNALLLAV